MLVTGGTVRLGLAISEALAESGWRVAASSHRPDAGAALVADLSLPGAADRLFAAAAAYFGGEPPQAVVNNAALYPGEGEAAWRVNFEAPVRLAELAAEAGGGRCAVHILDSRVLEPGFAPATRYEAAKAALLEAVFRQAAEAAAGGRARVCGVAPGPVLAPVAVREKAAFAPLGRPLPRDVGRAVAFLLEARATTGCVIPVSGTAARAMPAG